MSLKPEHHFTLDLGQLTLCFADEKGQAWLAIHVPKHFTAKAGMLGMPCQTLCGMNLHRFHLSCSSCRLRRVWLGAMPNLIRVHVHSIAIWDDRPQARLKDLLLKKLISVCEWLAN